MLNSFIFYRSFFTALSHFSDEERLKLYDTICGYALGYDAQQLNGLPLAVWDLIKPQIDANEKRAIAGKKGGRKKSASENIRKEETVGYENNETIGYENNETIGY